MQTDADFEDLALLFGFTVRVSSGAEISVFPITFPILFIGTLAASRFTIVVELLTKPDEGFPYTFPLTFSTPNLDMMKCFFNKLKPANTQIIFKQI